MKSIENPQGVSADTELTNNEAIATEPAASSPEAITNSEEGVIEQPQAGWLSRTVSALGFGRRNGETPEGKLPVEASQESQEASMIAEVEAMPAEERKQLEFSLAHFGYQIEEGKNN